MATLIDLARKSTKKWFFIARYRDRELRSRFCPQYGIDVRLVRGAVTEIICNIYLNRYALFIDFGRRFKSDD